MEEELVSLYISVLKFTNEVIKGGAIKALTRPEKLEIIMAIFKGSVKNVQNLYLFECDCNP